MKKIKKLLAVFAAVSVALMLPLQTMAAVDLNAKYDISTNPVSYTHLTLPTKLEV